MMRILFSLCLLISWSCNSSNEKAQNVNSTSEKEIQTPLEFAMVIHGGAGTIKKENMSPEKEAEYRKKLNEVLIKGKEILSKGGSSLDAVEQCIKIMENSPLFNAGRGAVFTHAGTNEMDASIMVGADLNAGAVAGVTRVKNPISAARAVMERSKHVMLSGQGADEFSQKHNLEMVNPEYFHTQDRFETLQKVKAKDVGSIHRNSSFPDSKYGTVGVVALDKYGQIAAGTSTGGMTNKRWNRIGDSPIIGAGTYAENGVAGVSCTGHGEYFIRHAVAHDVIAKVKYQKVSLEEACQDIVMKKLKSIDAAGGLIALDHFGNVSMTFNTSGMYRGYVKPNESFVGLFDTDSPSK